METYISSIKSSRIKYTSNYLAAVFIVLLLFYFNSFYSIGRDIFLLVYIISAVLILSPELLRNRHYHKLTDKNIIIIKGFGQSKRSVLHSFILDIHVTQNPFTKSILDIGSIKIDSFSGKSIIMSGIKRPSEIAKTIQGLMFASQKARQ